MYKLMIVDNEQIIRQNLHHSIDWASMDVEVVCEAANGYDAMRLAGIYAPDIVITDIRMPIMDGLEFSRNLRRVMPAVYIIMLSGYSDTDYLQQAIRIGINVYLMKTADSTPIIQEVENAKQVIARQRESKQENVILQSILDTYLQSIVSKFMQDLLQRRRSPQYLLTVSKQLGLFLEGPQYVLLAGNAFENTTETDLADLRSALTDYHAVVSNVQDRILCVLLNVTSLTNEILDSIELRLNDYFQKRKTGFLYAKAVKDLEELAKQYQQITALLPALFWNDSPLICIHEMPHTTEGDFHAQELSLLEAIQSMDREQFEAQLVAYIDVAKAALVPVGELNASLARLEMASRTVWHLEPCSSALPVQADTSREWVNRLHHLYPKDAEEKGLAENAQLYIEQHFTEEIRLATLASALFVSPSHLSRVFKQHHGVGIKQYINQCRVHQAKRLMDQGEKNMTVIAEKVGYQDYRRLAENFQKYAGTSLKEYRSKGY